MVNLNRHNFDFSKKLFFHPEKIVAYKNQERPFPTTVELDLINICNHRCTFCNCADTLGSDNSALDTQVLMCRLEEAYTLGTRGISFTGGGEPMVHPDYLNLIAFTKQLGMDNGTITNGSLIKDKCVPIMHQNLQWVRISMAAGDRENYKKVQGLDHFDRVLDNIRKLTLSRAEYQSKLNVGIRILVTPQNVEGLIEFAHSISDSKIDYLQFAPDQYSTDGGVFWNSLVTQSTFETVMNILEAEGIRLLKAGYSVDRKGIDVPRTCYAHFFQVAVTAEGNVIFCKNAREKDQYVVGNINENTLSEIWAGEKNKAIESWVRPNNCGLFCKNMALNKAMEETLYPDPSMSPNFVN